MKWKMPHDFCPEAPCPRAWHPLPPLGGAHFNPL
jgi:hypothetical protein